MSQKIIIITSLIVEVLMMFFLSEKSFGKPLEKTETTKEYAQKLTKFLGQPVKKFIEVYPGSKQIWGKGMYGNHYEFKNGEVCDFLFYFDDSRTGPSIVNDVSVSGEACFGVHDFR